MLIHLCVSQPLSLPPISNQYHQSDNGGSPWFGGLNVPLRSGKTTPYEGGVRVPGFAVDFTEDGRHFGRTRSPVMPMAATPAVTADASTESPAAVSSVEAEASSASASAPASDSSSASASVSPSASASASSASAPQQSAARAFNGMMHISDWLPTFLALAGVDANTVAALQLDGVNQARGVSDESTK
jgi:arylsulfatase A-like enzyme